MYCVCVVCIAGVACANKAHIDNICKPVYMYKLKAALCYINSMGMATRHPGTPELEFGSSGPSASLKPDCPCVHCRPFVRSHKALMNQQSKLYLSVHPMCGNLLASCCSNCCSAL